MYAVAPNFSSAHPNARERVCYTPYVSTIAAILATSCKIPEVFGGSNLLLLQVLDLESNSVRDAEQAIQLGTCPRLWSLTLAANPVCRDIYYRQTIVEAVPHLASLDEENVTGLTSGSP